MASKRRDAPHLVAPIRRYATSKVGSTAFTMLMHWSELGSQPPTWSQRSQQISCIP